MQDFFKKDAEVPSTRKKAEEAVSTLLESSWTFIKGLDGVARLHIGGEKQSVIGYLSLKSPIQQDAQFPLHTQKALSVLGFCYEGPTSTQDQLTEK